MLTDLDKKIIHRLQESIPITTDPYKNISEELGIDEDELINRMKYYNETGILKRVGAVLYHRRAGFKANAMVAWKVSKKDVDSVGNYMASLSYVSHCYERKVCDLWEYNLYTMIHARNREKCNEIIENISYKAGIEDYKVLYSIKELKKTSMKYFK
ncbi:siroheme decarboxylase subunit beta [Clostridium sp. JNZ X4-2]